MKTRPQCWSTFMHKGNIFVHSMGGDHVCIGRDNTRSAIVNPHGRPANQEFCLWCHHVVDVSGNKSLQMSTESYPQTTITPQDYSNPTNKNALRHNILLASSRVTLQLHETLLVSNLFWSIAPEIRTQARTKDIARTTVTIVACRHCSQTRNC